MRRSISFTISEQSQVGEARRFARNLAAEELGFNETESGKVSIVVTELATNLLKHAQKGELIFRAISQGPIRGLEILCLDQGPGMDNLTECMRDGYTTAGSPGTGLGAIRRLSRHFEINSVPAVGTAVMARLWASPRPSGLGPFEIGAVSIPVEGEQVCGDGWAIQTETENPLFLVTDGIGHGPDATEAADEAVRIFEASRNQTLADILLDINGSLRKTRGAAGAITQLFPQAGEVHFAGIGNISAVVINSELKSQGMASLNGTLGGEFHGVQEFTYPWEKNSILVMHSDGLIAGWHLNRYPGLLTKHPSLIAGVLYRDYKRGKDDTTVLVVKERT
jgi:anti-sigma regulatory factor (Ser/Thr protein kinase)